MGITVDDFIEILQEKKRIGEIHGDETLVVRIDGEDCFHIDEVTAFTRDFTCIDIECGLIAEFEFDEEESCAGETS